MQCPCLHTKTIKCILNNRHLFIVGSLCWAGSRNNEDTRSIVLRPAEGLFKCSSAGVLLPPPIANISVILHHHITVVKSILLCYTYVVRKKQILILTRQDDRESYDNAANYREKMSQSERLNDYTVGHLEDLVFYYDGKSLKVLLSGDDIAQFDGLFLVGWFKTKKLEDTALSVAKYFEHHGKKVLNTEALFTRSTTKLSQYVIAALHGVSVTPFIFSNNTKLLQQELKKWPHGYPIIVKGTQASRGRDNYLVESYDGVCKAFSSLKKDDNLRFVVQQFVPNNGDYRIIVMGDSVKYVIHREATGGSHLNNTSQGGIAHEVALDQLPVAVLEQSVTIARLLRREITGVDMIAHSQTGDFYMLEINNMPQLATGALVDEKLHQLDAFLHQEM